MSVKNICLIYIFLMTHMTNSIANEVNAYSFQFEDSSGNIVNLSDYKGKVILVVNTASKCGFTSQYADLEQLWEKYRERGLIILAVPSNDFGSQEPGTNEEIKTFCQTKFDVNFPIMSKVNVVGQDAHPFYKWAESQVNYFGKPKWNFHKYIIGKKGQMLQWFSSITSPLDDRLISIIETELEIKKSN